MPDKDWDKLNPIQLGWTAKYYFMMEFASYGFKVDPSKNRDQHIDFTVSHNTSPIHEVKVRSVRGLNYIFFEKGKFKLSGSLLAAVAIFTQFELPKLYLIPSTVWNKPDAIFVSRDYIGKKSKPEWGIYLSEKALPVLEEYTFLKKIGALM